MNMIPPLQRKLLPKNWAPSAAVNTVYNGPPIPLAYIETWQLFTNLSPTQVQWFEAQPEFQNVLAYVSLFPSAATVAMPVAVVNSALLAAGKTLATVAMPSPLQPLGGLPTA